ncbi:MAG TPA: hypothetical protein VNO26_05855 [Candidatus Limnocylindria bacterium]|nr:hypothetical protein [Candidatus Limnocylindria bacterium]
MPSTTARSSIASRIVVTLLAAAGLIGAPFATAFYAGGGKDAAKGNDCLIGYDGVDPDQVTVDAKGKSTFLCQDCDPTCDRDGLGSANGSCLIQIGACINQSGVEGCTPAAALDKAKAKGRVKGVKGAAGTIVIDTSALLQGSACGGLVDVLVPTKETKKGVKDGKASLSLRAQVKKNKAEGTPGRKDTDKLTILCTPLPEGQSCPSGTTTTTLPPVPKVLSFRTGAPTGECGSVRSGGASGTVRKVLNCGGLNVGGGNSTVAEGPTPANAETQMNVDCTGSQCTVSGRSAAETGNAFNCSAIGCPFGPWLPIANAGASTCVRNTFSSPASGTLDTSTGSFTGAFPLTSAVFLTANAALPCPLCVGGTPGVEDSGTCQTDWTSGAGPSPDAGNPCTPVNAEGNTHDCGPPAAVALTPFAVNLDPITTGTASFSDAGGLFCPAQTTGGAFGCSGAGSPNAICPGGNEAPVPDYIDEVGIDAGPLTVGQPANATLASVFCIPDPGNFVIASAANLPGPGATSLPGTFTLLP